MVDSKQTVAEAAFQVMAFNQQVFDRLRIPVISTARPFAFYRKVFFDGASHQGVLSELKGKTLIDVGCGLTPFCHDSMYQECFRAGIPFYGIDPKLNGAFKFGLFDRLKAFGTGAAATPDPNAPGLDKALPAFANELPFEDHGVDVILSSWLLFAWIKDHDLLAQIFTEFDRILRPGGSIRFYPSMHWDSIARRYPALAELGERYHIEQRFLMGLNPASLPPSYVTLMHK